MIALEVALERPDAVDHVAADRGARRRPGRWPIAWNHIQLELDRPRSASEGLALARQLAMTTYRSEADFDDRFGRGREPDGRFSIASYLDHQGDKLLERFDPDTYRVLVRVMDGHDVGRDRGGIVEALPGARRGRHRASRASASRATSCTAPDQVRRARRRAAAAGVGRHATARSARSRATTRSSIEWDQLDRDRRARRSPTGSRAPCAAARIAPEAVAGAA